MCNHSRGLLHYLRGYWRSTPVFGLQFGWGRWSRSAAGCCLPSARHVQRSGVRASHRWAWRRNMPAGPPCPGQNRLLLRTLCVKNPARFDLPGEREGKSAVIMLRPRQQRLQQGSAALSSGADTSALWKLQHCHNWSTLDFMGYYCQARWCTGHRKALFMLLQKALQHRYVKWVIQHQAQTSTWK